MLTRSVVLACGPPFSACSCSLKHLATEASTTFTPTNQLRMLHRRVAKLSRKLDGLEPRAGI